MRGWGSKDKSLDNLSDRLDRLEEERGEVKPFEDNDVNDRPYATAEELEQMSSMERYVAWFNWHVREIMPYYKAEVMRLHSITSDEYDSRTLEYERVAHALGLDYQELQDKFKQGELEHKRAGCDSTGLDNGWRDEDPNAVF